MLIKAYLLADLFQMCDMGINEIFKQFEKGKKSPTSNLLVDRQLRDICN